MKMNINKVVIINQSTGYLTVDIVNAYCKVYKDVTLITGRVEEYDRKLSSDAKVCKIISYNKSSVFMRILTWIVGFVQILFVLLSFQMLWLFMLLIRLLPILHLCY